MNVTLLLLSSACVAGQAPVVATGAGCSGCGSAAVAAPTFASASFGEAACGSCGTPAVAGRPGLFDRVRGLFRRGNGCGAGDCGGAPVLTAAPTPSPIRSSFVATHSATATPCCGPVMASSFPVGFSGCCDAGPAPRAGLFSRLRARTSGGACGCDGTSAVVASAPVAHAAPVVPGCTPTVGTVVNTPVVTPPAVMPKPVDPKEPAKEPKTAPKAEPAKEPKKESKTEGTSLPQSLPAIPADLPRIPTLRGVGGN